MKITPVISFLALLTLSGNTVAGSYRISALDSLGVGIQSVSAINDAGQIVGAYNVDRAGTTHSFIYEHGVMKDLGVERYNLGYTSSTAVGINNSGLIALGLRSRTNAAVNYYTDSSGSFLANLGGYTSNPALDFNNSGTRLIENGADGGKYYSLLTGCTASGSRYNCTARAITLSGPMPSYPYYYSVNPVAYDINDRGQVVVRRNDSMGNGGLYLYENGSGTKVFDLPKTAGADVWAQINAWDAWKFNELNNNDLIVGLDATIEYTDNIGYFRDHGFIIDATNGNYIDLGKGEAFGINDHDQVIGKDYVGGFYMYEDGVFNYLDQAIDDPTWTIAGITDINNAGQIVGMGWHDGVYTGFVLTAVPEPATYMSLGLGMAALFGLRNRMRDRQEPRSVEVA